MQQLEPLQHWSRQGMHYPEVKDIMDRVRLGLDSEERLSFFKCADKESMDKENQEARQEENIVRLCTENILHYAWDPKPELKDQVIAVEINSFLSFHITFQQGIVEKKKTGELMSNQNHTATQ